MQDTLFGGRYCNGTLVELKVSGMARSADWIKTEYNNQSSPATFYAISAAAAGSAAENVVWTNVTGASASGNSLTKTAATAATAWGNAGAASTKSIVSGDGYVEFKVTSLNTGMLGLSHTDANQDYTSIEFALLPKSYDTCNFNYIGRFLEPSGRPLPQG